RAMQRGLNSGAINLGTLQCSPHVVSRTNGLRMVATKGDVFGWLGCVSHGDVNIGLNGQEVYVGGVRQEDDSTTCGSAQKTANGSVISIDIGSGVHYHMSPGTGQLPGGAQCRDFQHG